MTQESKTWKLIAGGILTLLGLGIIAIHVMVILSPLRAAEHVDAQLLSALTKFTIVLVFTNWPSALLLGFGIPWIWNDRPIVRVWSYRIAAVFFVVGAALGLYLLFIGPGHELISSWTRTRIGIAAAIYVLVSLLFYLRSGKVLERIKGAGEPEVIAPRRVLRSSRQASIASCNVLQMGPDSRQVWQFDNRSSGVTPGRSETSRPGEPLPASLVAKSWSSLWQKKLNIAWLPPESVFLRVAHFPETSPDELLSMVELQLEKLSPIPVTQAVWSLHVLPTAPGATAVSGAAGRLQTVIVVIVARNVIEEFLGKLEGEGYLADRLELPLLDQLQAASILEDGAWIYPEARGGRDMALVAWWYGGTLRNVDLLSMPAADRSAGLKDQLTQMAWAGELDGWLTSPPRWHLVGDESASEWVKLLQEGLEQSVEVIPPLSGRELAARTAQRAVHADPRVNLLPLEFADRYRQQFVDRLWLRGLFAALALYGVGLLVYFTAVGFMNFKTSSAEGQVRNVSLDYTNALQIKAQYQVLKERQELKYAALECWEAIAETLPENITLDSMNFGEARGTGAGAGKTLSLAGTAPASEVNALFDFSDKLRRWTSRGQDGKAGQPLFNLNNNENVQTHINPGGSTVRWTYELELKRTEKL